MKNKNPKTLKNKILTGLLALAFAGGLSSYAATTNTWAVDGDGYWNSPGNWLPAEVPNSPEAVAIFDLPINESRTIIADASVTLGFLDISSTSPDTSLTYTFLVDPEVTWKMDNAGQGATIRLYRTGNFANVDRIHVPLELADDLIAYSSGRYLALAGVISESGGPRTIIKTGAGLFNLENTGNTFSGGVIIKEGTLNSPGAGKIGSGPIVVGDTTGSASAHLIGGTTSSSTSAHYTNAVIIAAGSSGTKTMRSSGSNRNIMFVGPIELNDDVEVTAAANTGYVNLNAPISGTGHIMVRSDLGRANSYVRLGSLTASSGGVTLAAGNLRLGGHNALGTGTLTIEDNTILSSDGNSNRQPTNSVIVNGNFQIAHTNGGAGTIRLHGDVDIGSGIRLIANGGTVSHGFHGPISGTGGLMLQDTNTSNVKYFQFYGTNTYSGGLTILNGNVQFTGDFALGTGLVTLGDATTEKNVQLLGNGTVANNVSVVPGVSGDRILYCDSNTNPLRFAGGIHLATDLLLGANNNRTLVLSGPVSGTGSLTFRGAALDVFGLSGANTFDGTTTVNGGTLYVTNSTGSATGAGAVAVQTGAILAGTGAIAGLTTLADGATLTPGVGDIGTLTFGGALTLSASSTTVMELNKALATNDLVIAESVGFGGTLVLTNLAGALSEGDSFKLFSTTGVNTGDFSAVTILNSAATAVFDPATGTVLIHGGIPDYPTDIGFAMTGEGLSLSWPETHKGWVVQSNSVDIADSAAWYTIEGSGEGTSLTVPVNSTTPKVFYRLSMP